MGKIYARQCDPEYQDSTLYCDFENYENIIISGNKYYKDYVAEDISDILTELDSGELAELVEAFNCYGKNASNYAWTLGYNNVSQLINDRLPRCGGKYTTRQIHELRDLIPSYYNELCGDKSRQMLLRILELITGDKWAEHTIKGCCQGDWQDVLYDCARYDRDDIKVLECLYFNTGTEWTVMEDYDGDEAEIDPEDIIGFGMYTVSWSDENIKREIADACGGDIDPSDVVLFEWSGYRRTATYKIV